MSGTAETSETLKESVAPLERLSVTQVQAAQILGVTDQTIRNWERRGKLKGLRRGGVKLYPYQQIKELAGVA